MIKICALLLTAACAVYASPEWSEEQWQEHASVAEVTIRNPALEDTDLVQANGDTAFPWTPKCKAGITGLGVAPNVFVSPDGADDVPCEDTIDDCSEDYVPGKCVKSYWSTSCPLRCGVCTATADVIPGSREAPYKTLQFAADQRAKHAVEATEECVTINLMEGTYTNSDFGTDSGGSQYILNLNGLSDVIIKNDDETTGASAPAAVSLVFDGPGGFRGGLSSAPVTDVEIYGFEISGPNLEITYEEAMADRLVGSKRFSGQGISIWAGHRIWMHDLKVHDTPAAGLRVNNADYLVVENCEVYRTTWWSRSAESAIVFAQSVNIDQETKTKMIMRRNKVYDNMNKIPYYNKNYAYDYFPIGKDQCKDETDLAACKTLYDCCGPTKKWCCDDTAKKSACPWQCRYGKAAQDYVIDGQGVYVTRNSDTYLAGTMELSDNIAYNNGINGLVFHRTFNGVVKRNIIFNNGQLPKDSQDQSLVCDKPTDADCWKIPLSASLNPDKAKTGRQPYSGLTLSNAKNVKLWSNVVKARYSDDKSYEFEIDSGYDYNLEKGSGNLNCQGKVTDKIKSAVSDVAEGSSEYTQRCSQSVLDAYK